MFRASGNYTKKKEKKKKEKKEEERKERKRNKFWHSLSMGFPRSRLKIRIQVQAIYLRRESKKHLFGNGDVTGKEKGP